MMLNRVTYCVLVLTTFTLVGCSSARTNILDRPITNRILSSIAQTLELHDQDVTTVSVSLNWGVGGAVVRSVDEDRIHARSVEFSLDENLNVSIIDSKTEYSVINGALSQVITDFGLFYNCNSRFERDDNAPHHRWIIRGNLLEVVEVPICGGAADIYVGMRHVYCGLESEGAKSDFKQAVELFNMDPTCAQELLLDIFDNYARTLEQE